MNSSKKRALTGFSLILMYILGFLVFWFFNFQRVVVKGDSMFPTFKNGQVLWASRAYWLIGPISGPTSDRPGDIVVLHDEEQGGYLIKRVHRIGGQAVDPEYVPADFAFGRMQDEYVVPAGHYYVLGDNLEVSQDSRSFGAIPAHEVIGKYVPFTWASIALATVPVLIILLIAFWKPRESLEVRVADEVGA